MRNVEINRVFCFAVLVIGIMEAQGLVGTSQEIPPGHTIPELFLTAVRVEISIPFIPKVGEVFEATLTIYCKNDLESDRFGRPGPDYKVEFTGDVEIIEGREHIIYDDLQKGETRRFKAKMIIKAPKKRVGIAGGIVTTKPPHFAQGANVEIFLVDEKSGQYGIKEEYEGKLPVEYRYDPIDGSFTCSPSQNPAPVEENRKIIKMIKTLEPALSDSEALLLHSDQYRVGHPKGIPKWDKQNQRWLEEEIFEYYLKDNWFKALREGKREEWLKKEKQKIADTWKERRLNFFRDDNNSSSSGQYITNRISKEFKGVWRFKDHLYKC